MVVVNYMAVLLPLNGRSTGEISDAYPNLFAPAGVTFSIWGLIYTLLLLYVIYQFTRSDDVVVGKINRIFMVNALLNAAWIFAWHYDVIWASVLIMLALLVTLIKIADILRAQTFSAKEKFFVRLPFSIYFGWITVATIANISVFLVSLGWNGFGLADYVWTCIILLVGALIGIVRMRHDGNVPYGLVIVWAYLGILLKHVSASGFDGQYTSIITTVSVCLALVLFFLLKLSVKKVN